MSENTKKWIKNILLVLSLIPYVVFLVLGVVNCLQAESYRRLYALAEPLIDFWDDCIGYMEPWRLGMLIFSVGYPVFYLLDKGARKMSAGELKTAEEKKEVPLSYVIYLFSFTPYLLLLCASIFGIDFGFFGNSSTYYGWDAVVIQSLVLFYIPILPAAALYQIIFRILMRKKLSRGQKMVSRVLFLSIAGALCLSCVVCHELEEAEADRVYNQDKEIIEAYLKEEFGEEYAAEMEVMKPYNISPNYQVKTPIMDSTFLVCLDESHSKVCSCYFCDAFVREFDLQTLLAEKIAERYDVPDTTELGFVIKSFPFQKAFEQDLDNLLESSDFELTCVYLKTDRYDQKEVIREINRFYSGYGRDVLRYRDNPFLIFYVRERDVFFAEVRSIPSKTELGDGYHLKFSGYKNGDGVTSIPYDELDIRLDP